MNFKISFEKSDFEDDEFVEDMQHVYQFYYAAIVLEYKERKEKLIKQFGTLVEATQYINDNNIQFGNLIFYNFEIQQLKKKFKERNL